MQHAGHGRQGLLGVEPGHRQIAHALGGLRGGVYGVPAELAGLGCQLGQFFAFGVGQRPDPGHRIFKADGQRRRSGRRHAHAHRPHDAAAQIGTLIPQRRLLRKIGRQRGLTAPGAIHIGGQGLVFAPQIADGTFRSADAGHMLPVGCAGAAQTLRESGDAALGLFDLAGHTSGDGTRNL